MAQWRELGRHIRALNDIGAIMSAMRSLAFIEARRLADGALRQQETVAAIRAAIDNLVAHYPRARPDVMPRRDVLVLIGSERGLCGDFNERVVSGLGLSNGADAGACIAVGSLLCQWLDEHGVAHVPIPGAVVNEDVPGVMARIAASVHDSTQQDHNVTSGLVVVHHDESGGVREERILPVPVMPPDPRWRGRPLLQLSPPALYGMLIEHYVFASMNALLIASLLAENRQRLDHMSAALDRLHKRVDELDSARRRARQEAITEEIEIILLGQQRRQDAR